MEEQEQKPVPNVAKVVKPVKAERKLTEEERLQIKQAEFEKKQRAERERVQELRRKMKTHITEEEVALERENHLSVETVAQTNEDTSIEKTVPEAEIVAYSAKNKREYQRNLCRKYGIKRKALQEAIEEAKKMFVARLTVNFNSKIVVAIVDLLEFGDI